MNKSAEEWLASTKYIGVTILDPDGWNRKNFEASWAEKITQEEFEKRVAASTITVDKNYQIQLTSTSCHLLEEY
ncbi:hypothetical protein LCGC14_2342690, partial [marine sediment metagenome]